MPRKSRQSRSQGRVDPGQHLPVEAWVLYEDNHLLAINKPPMLATMGVEAGRTSLVCEAKQYLKCKYSKPGNVFLGVVSRLDWQVSGVVVFARTSKAAARLARQFHDQRVRKIYWALVTGHAAAEEHCVDWIRKDERRKRMCIARPEHPMARKSSLRYRVLRRLQRCSLLEINLETGRKHQIRLQLAHRGHPVLGDRKYGSKQPFARGIALHARELTIEHPVGSQPLRLMARPPDSWAAYGIGESIDAGS